MKYTFSQLKTVNLNKTHLQKSFIFLSCLFLVLHISYGKPKKKSMKFFESFNTKEDSTWALNGQAFIDYGRLAFEGEGVNQAVLKKPLSGENNWNA